MILCRHCKQRIEPDPMYKYLSGQDWKKWFHSSPVNSRACQDEGKYDPWDPSTWLLTRAEPADWEEARELWNK